MWDQNVFFFLEKRTLVLIKQHETCTNLQVKSFIMILFDYNYFRTIAAIVTIFLFYVGRRGGTGGGLWGSGGSR